MNTVTKFIVRAKSRTSELLSAIILITLISLTAHASSVMIGGYDVSKIAAGTVAVLKDKGVVSEKESDEFSAAILKLSGDPLAASSAVVDIYEKIGAMLVAKSVVTAADIDGAKKIAEKSGGLKAGGLNPVVLAASFLDLMAGKGLLSQSSAQTILDASKNRNRK